MIAMAQCDSLGFDKARLVGVYQNKSCTKLKPLQLPLHIDDSLMMVLQFEDQVSKKYFNADKHKKNFDTFLKKYNSLCENELTKACSVQDKELFLSLPQLIYCVGCRRSVEHLFQQVQSLNHSVYEPLSISNEGALTISSNYILHPKKLFHLFYCVRPKLCDLLDSLINAKKNKRCIFHSLKMQKPTGIPIDSKPTLPKWCSSSIMDIWDRMCHECQEQIATLDCRDVLETLDSYLKKHRFCNECKAKVQRAFHILTGESKSISENGFCSAIYEGIHCCDEGIIATGSKSRHLHICTERSYIVHMLSQAESELLGSKKERHAKTIDIAQEEVCICLALHLYQRLHKVWHQKLTVEQTWLTLFYVGIEAVRQSFEMCIEEKVGISHVTALCEELELSDKLKDAKLQKKKLRRKRQKRKKDFKTSERTEVEDNIKDSQKLLSTQSVPNANCQRNGANSNGRFHLCLLDMFSNSDDCPCSDEISNSDSASELTKAEILEFERNRPQINMQRSRLRERIRQDFENFCNIATTNAANTH